jgi:hypothetical protein
MNGTLARELRDPLGRTGDNARLKVPERLEAGSITRQARFGKHDKLAWPSFIQDACNTRQIRLDIPGDSYLLNGYRISMELALPSVNRGVGRMVSRRRRFRNRR